MAFAFPELLVMFLFLGSPGGTDLLAVVDPAQYFAARQVEVSIDKMASVAGEAPQDAKTQVRQLLALRYLAAHPDKLKQAGKYAEHRQLLEAIAAGKKAQDSAGFAKDYAEQVLARLDGKTLPLPEAPKLREDALAWFPADASFVATLDTRLARTGMPTPFSPADLLKKIPDGGKMVFDAVDKLGNIRIDRLSMAYVHDDDMAKAKIYLRVTGKGNLAWIVGGIKELNPRMEETRRKDARGQNVTLLQQANQAPVLAFIGETEMLMVGYVNDRGKNEDLVDEALAVRAGKKPSVLAGGLKDRLQKIPSKAVAFAVGDVPREARQEFKQLLGGTPVMVAADIEKLPVGYDITVNGTMASSQEAQDAVMKIAGLRKEGIDALQQMLKQPDPRVPVNSLINLLQSLQMQSEGTELRLRLLVPRDILQSLPAWFMFF